MFSKNLQEIFCFLLKFEFKFYLHPRYSRHPDCISTCESFSSGKRSEHRETSHVQLTYVFWMSCFFSLGLFSSTIPDGNLFTASNENREIAKFRDQLSILRCSVKYQSDFMHVSTYYINFIYSLKIAPTTNKDFLLFCMSLSRQLKNF